MHISAGRFNNATLQCIFFVIIVVNVTRHTDDCCIPNLTLGHA